MPQIFTKRNILITLAILAIIVISYFILPLSLPLLVAFITSLFLEPLVKFLSKHLKMKRQLSIFIVFIIFVSFLSISSYFIVTKVVAEVVKIGENAPYYINEINYAWQKLEQNMSVAFEDVPIEVVTEVSRSVESFLEGLKTELTMIVNFQNVTKIVTNIPNYLVSIIVYLIALFLFMHDLPRLKSRFYAHLTKKTADKVSFMTSRLNYVVVGFFKAQFLVSIIIFVVSLIGLLFIAPKVAVVMSLIIWVIDVIPIIGSIVILGPWAIFHLVTGNVSLGTQLAVLAIILLTIRRTVEPKVMGGQIGLSPLATLISMYLGLKLFGILGFIIGPLLLIAFNTAREAGIIKLDFKI